MFFSLLHSFLLYDSFPLIHSHVSVFLVFFFSIFRVLSCLFHSFILPSFPFMFSFTVFLAFFGVIFTFFFLNNVEKAQHLVCKNEKHFQFHS